MKLLEFLKMVVFLVNKFRHTLLQKALGALYRYSRIGAREIGVPKTFTGIDSRVAAAILSQAQKEGKAYLAADRVYELLTAYGIPVAKWWLASHIPEAENAADFIGYPVVIKAESVNIIHKSDMGGVAVNLKKQRRSACCS